MQGPDLILLFLHAVYTCSIHLSMYAEVSGKC